MSIVLFLAAAAANAAAGQAPQPKKVADQDRIVCKSERFVGSHLSQRICKTKMEWETARKQSKEFMDNERTARDMCMGDNGSPCPHSLRPGIPAPSGGGVPQ